MLLLLFFSWPLVHEVCPNYEVVVFQPRTGTPLDLGSVSNCYVYILPNLILPSLPAARFLPGGGYLRTIDGYYRVITLF